MALLLTFLPAARKMQIGLYIKETLFCFVVIFKRNYSNNAIHRKKPVSFFSPDVAIQTVTNLGKKNALESLILSSSETGMLIFK